MRAERAALLDAAWRALDEAERDALQAALPALDKLIEGNRMNIGASSSNPRPSGRSRSRAVVAFMGIGLVDPILPALAHAARRDAEPGRAAVHELLRDHRPLDARHRLRLQPHRPAQDAARRPRARGRLQRARGRVGLDRRDRRLPRRLGPRQRALHRHRAGRDHRRGVAAACRGAIILYEAALGLGIASGPLLGGLLGGISWRGPFFGTAALMAIGFVAILARCSSRCPSPRARSRCSTRCKALRHRGLLITGRRRALLQLRLLHAARLHAVPAAHGRARARLRVLRLGPAAGDHVGVRRAARSSAASASSPTLAAMYAALVAILVVMGVVRGRRRPCSPSP